ncbi:MAG: histidinol-phosphate transaminase [Candidatus Mycalebacterium zealandia]|nr:MAG: histidinol-phosphate transaminase [Candidatus Mycalebacterium zealandia]
MAGIEKLLHRVSPSVRALSAYDSSRPRRRIKLDGNESPFSLSGELRSEIARVAENLPLNRYPDPNCEWLKKAVSERTGTDSSGIVFGNGSDELIQILIAAFCGESETVLVPAPTFSMYALTAQVLGKKVVKENLTPDFDINPEAMLAAMNAHNPDIVFLASPNSPTGNLLSPGKVEAVIAGAPGIVVVDEAYFSFCGKTHVALMKKYENLAVMRTFSKIGFAALRLGALFMNPELAAQAEKVRLPYNINSFTQAAARVFFENPGVFEENINIIKSEREKMFQTLGSIDAIKVFPSAANFFLIQFNGAKTAGEVHRALIEKDILTRNFPDTDMADCLRVTIGLPEENREFEESLRAIISGL